MKNYKKEQESKDVPFRKKILSTYFSPKTSKMIVAYRELQTLITAFLTNQCCLKQKEMMLLNDDDITNDRKKRTS